MKIGILICALLYIMFTSSAWAKRGATPVVAPLIYHNIMYLAPNDNGIREYIQASDIKTKKILWKLTIFTNQIHPELEEDVQWTFIEKLTLKKGNLDITDEKGRQFRVDLRTRQVKRLK